ncbi:hydrogen peroxide-inducible genes activator [Hyphomicrobium sp. D-2]|uniref:hydrogen peroxide-inducible genes activator n=1 Tax=Hyphomicrobium sp. D-2 TaxID=3041621 RepID=UPI002456FCBF|nr:hydrogen peroxide-inducible genes activator [Hyphomicrobium sp. D-2]MDH4982385.1 hydrogen peroxide-inducible genes activator [Hyphomicrobium sp. D-2]
MRPHVTLKQLRYFDALAREQHFGRAAEACSITQPALSMQITELEQQLGLVLVERTRSGVLLSDKGREIAARAARILCDVNEMIDFALHANNVLAGSLRLGVIPSIAPYMLPPLLPLLREGYPTLELHVRETQTLLLMQELTEGKLDVVLLALPITQADIETMPLFDDHFLLALPKSKKLASRVRATKDLIEHERLLLLEEGHCLREQALTYCSLQQSSAVNTFGVSSLSTIVEMVAAGYGITLLPEMCLNVEARGRDIGITRFVEPQPLRTVGLAWRATSPRADDFRELGRLINLAWSKALIPPAQRETVPNNPASTNAQKS